MLLLLLDLALFFGAALAIGSATFALSFYFISFHRTLNAAEQGFVRTVHLVLAAATLLAAGAEVGLYLYLRYLELEALLTSASSMKWTLLALATLALAMQYRRLLPLWFSTALLATSWYMFAIVHVFRVLSVSYTLWLGYYLLFLGITLALLELSRRITQRRERIEA